MAVGQELLAQNILKSGLNADFGPPVDLNDCVSVMAVCIVYTEYDIMYDVYEIMYDMYESMYGMAGCMVCMRVYCIW